MFCFGRTSLLQALSRFGLLFFVALIGIAGTASAQDRRQNAPGEFDFYVLSLSWSPSFCEQASERGSGGRSQNQGGGRPDFFVVPALGPQYVHGFPGYFHRAPPRPDPQNLYPMLPH